MGYYSRYELKAEPWPEALGQVIADHEEASYALSPDGKSFDSSKWYDHVRDMSAVSRRFPGVLFTLRKEGEQPGDISISYFRDGLVQVCPGRIVFDDFDPGKLRAAEG